jgi:hypothetical protein
MTSPRGSGRVAALLIGAVSVNAARAGNELTDVSVKGNDGTYVINVTTQRGDCGLHQWLILVASGRVSAAGDIDVSGQITARGVVTLRFEQFGHVANVTGRIKKGLGAGTWTAPTLYCAGSWRATRRG